MCGLVGIAGKLEFKDEATMKRLFIYDYFRGPDSTGFAALRRDGDTHVVKIASHPLDLFDMGKFTKALSGYISTVFLGHNRAATRGVVNNINAHPYEYGHIIGAHNGTLDISSWKALTELLGEDTGVDSQAIFACIEKFGIEETIKHMSGAWALTWIDTKENTLNFLRNNERPFWYAFTKGFNRILWASEHPMIEAATSLSTQGYEFEDTEDGSRYFATVVNRWYRIPLDELCAGSKERPNFQVKELKGKEVPKVTYTSTGGSPFHRTVEKDGISNVNESTKNSSTHTVLPGKTSVSPVHFTASWKKPFGDYVDKGKFEMDAAYGCSWCSEHVEYDEPGITYYEPTGTVLCPKCTGNTNTKAYLESIDLNDSIDDIPPLSSIC